MKGIEGKVVFITGASSGIGQACACVFARAKARLILAARRSERLDETASELMERSGTECHLLALDVRDRKAVERSLSSLPAKWRKIDILVNNAGLGLGLDKVQDGNPDDWDQMLDTNVKGLLYVTRAVLPGMIERGQGHVINIGSLAGRELYPGGNVYCASKFAVKALTRGLKMDLLGTPVRVSTVDPGMVETEFSITRFHGDEARAARVYQGLKALAPLDIAEAVLWVASRPQHMDVTEMVILPTAQASATMAHREP